MITKLITGIKTMLGYSAPPSVNLPHAVGIPYIERVPRALRELQNKPKDKDTP